MSKNKIQIGSVEMKSNVEVIFLNSLFVAKTVRTAMLYALVQEHFTNVMSNVSPIDPKMLWAMKEVEEYFTQLTDAFEPEPAPEDKHPEDLYEPKNAYED